VIQLVTSLVLENIVPHFFTLYIIPVFHAKELGKSPKRSSSTGRVLNIVEYEQLVISLNKHFPDVCGTVP